MLEHDEEATQEASDRMVRARVMLRWVLGGVVFGALFVTVGWITAISREGVYSILDAHQNQPVLYIVDLAPFVLGGTGFGIGLFHSRLIQIRQSIEHQVKTRTADLQQALHDLSVTQAELLNAQKLEAIGGLAAGIAHEINTPIQYVGDNTRFVEESFGDLLAVAKAAARLVEAVSQVGEAAGVIADYEEVAAEADIEFLAEEVPSALQESLAGIEQVASIVKALKSFAHPGTGSKTPADLNDTITNTVAVARNEWKYVADMDLSGLDADLPPVPILEGPIKQVLLNMIINAAHAIEDATGGGKERGTIAISTSASGDLAHVTIADTGSGIPEEIRERIFEPFFTTKEVGKGSGQGMAIARSIIDKHGGRLTFESEVGKGTTFRISLPLGATGAASAVESAAA